MKIKPSIEEAKKYSDDYTIIPLSFEMVMNYTPIGIIKKISRISSHCFMLESKEDKKQTGRYTFIGFDPKAEISCKDYALKIVNGNEEKNLKANPKPYIKELMEQYKTPKLSYLPNFTGGLVGYFGYDYVKYSEPELELKANDDGDFKDIDLMLFDKLIAFDHYEEKIIIIVNIKTDRLEENYKKGVEEIEKIKNIIDNSPLIEPKAPVITGDFKPLFDEKEYSSMVTKAKDYIKEGDIFQVVLSNRLEAKMDGSLLKAYEILRTMNPSPYMFYFLSEDIEIAGASPETLVKLEDKTLSTFPLAGTRPRGETAEEDKALEESLLADEKELAEHNMLVDLGRNDLGKISEFGSVKVADYHKILRFSHVMHIGSTVKSTIRNDKNALDAVDAVLPAGTLSGAPKIRAIEIIDELENNKRGIYGGAIGYIDFTGNLDICIAIRLAYKKNGKVYIRSGAGIVADSNPQKEHQECINKAKAVVNAIHLASNKEE
ncbi:MAG: anthranilate synthase component I [Clostridiales bacterium]|nr:anthranilate synthase component I [Clostridiales bacterium]